MANRSFVIEPQGAFRLRESALFGFGQRMRPAGVGDRDPEFDGVMRLAFCLDGTYRQQVGVELRQDADDGPVEAVVHGAGDLDVVRGQVARMLSLDHDATGYDEVGQRDPIIARLQAAAPGLRPPLFHSPYEAAAWGVLSVRKPGWQADKIRAGLNAAHGRTFTLAGQKVAALPTPTQLLAVESFESIDPTRLGRLHGVAQAALDGLLDAATLRAMDPNDAMKAVQQIKGIGPFYSSLIIIRATGVTDVLPVQEPRALAIAGDLYGLGEPALPKQLAEIAETWRPWRTWCTVLLRAAGGRLEEMNDVDDSTASGDSDGGSPPKRDEPRKKKKKQPPPAASAPAPPTASTPPRGGVNSTTHTRNG